MCSASFFFAMFFNIKAVNDCFFTLEFSEKNIPYNPVFILVDLHQQAENKSVTENQGGFSM